MQNCSTAERRFYGKSEGTLWLISTYLLRHMTKKNYLSTHERTHTQTDTKPHHTFRFLLFPRLVDLFFVQRCHVRFVVDDAKTVTAAASSCRVSCILRARGLLAPFLFFSVITTSCVL